MTSEHDAWLLEAAKKGDAEEVARALRCFGVSVEAKDRYGWTPLYHAVYHGHLAAAEILWANNAKVDVIDDFYDRPMLHWPVYWGNLRMAGLLLKWGANPVIPDLRGDTPLHVAARDRNVEMAALLLDHGARTYITNKKGDTPQGLWPEVSKVHRELDLRKDVANMSALNGQFFRAVCAGKCGEVESLVNPGWLARAWRGIPDVNCRSARDGRTPILAAILNGSREIVKTLLAVGADVKAADMNAKYDDGWTPLCRAVYHCDRESVEMLLAAGADVNCPDDCDCTPLHVAAMNDMKDMVAILLSAGANVNARNKWGRTPLLEAVKETIISRSSMHGDEKLFNMLLNAGADPTIAETGETLRGDKNLCPMDFADFRKIVERRRRNLLLRRARRNVPTL